MNKGTVKKWTARGFGFIEMEDGNDIFCHMSNLEDGRKHLLIGENVTFDIEDDSRSGKPRAANVVGDGTGEEPDLTPRDDRQRDDRRGGGRESRGYGGGRESGGYGRREERSYGGGRDRGYGGGRGGDRERGGRESGGYGGRGGDRGGSGSRGVCYQFKDGNCSYGDRCRFSHEM